MEMAFPSSQVKVVIPVAFLKNFPSLFVTSILTPGFLLQVDAIARTPVLISAAIDKQAKYVLLKGFFEKYLYGTLTIHLSKSAYSTLTPLKNAEGKFFNRYNLNLKGCCNIL